MERFMAILIEHFGGAFPLWLAPTQAAVLTISEKYNDYAREVEAALKAAGLRTEGRFGAEKIGLKIRDTALQKIPYALIIGGQEAQNRTVGVRHNRSNQDLGQMPLSEFIERCKQEDRTRGNSPVAPAPASARATTFDEPRA
jgi:threonyl-tRNA synthetase